MLRALYSAAAGMQSQQMNLDVISNNLANVNTTGFKESKLEFQDLLYQTTRAAGSEQAAAINCPAACKSARARFPLPRNAFSPRANFRRPASNWTWRSRATASLKCKCPMARMAYTRDGAFQTNSQGHIVTSDGYPLEGGFQPVPTGTTNITMSANGAVTYTTASGTTNFQVQLVQFNNPGGLDAVGHNLYKETAASGTPELGDPGQNGLGELQQGYLELSNVSVVQEMVNLILAQRAYEVNSKAVQAADEMMQESNNLQH